jgi:hypothetical protein
MIRPYVLSIIQNQTRAFTTLALALVILDQLGLSRSGSCWLMYCGPLGLLANRCLETPRSYNLDTMNTDEILGDKMT